MFPEKFYVAAEPEKMREIFSFLMANVHLMSSLYPILTKEYVCCQSLVKESKFKFNQFGAFGIAVMYVLCQIKSRASGKTLLHFS